MEFLHSSRLFTWGILRRFYWMLPTLLVDPFDLLKTLFGVEYNPPTWIVWAVFSFGLFLAACLAYHEARTKRGSSAPAAQEVTEAIDRLMNMHFTVGGEHKHEIDGVTVLNAIGSDLAAGVSSHHIGTLLSRNLDIWIGPTMRQILGEMRLADIIEGQFRQPAQADQMGRYQSIAAAPYTMYSLTPLGARVVTSLRENTTRSAT